jgi:hypothetical protein
MGAWGYGLLQNDSSQDGLLHVIRSVSDDVVGLRRRKPTPDSAGRLAGAVGLLVQLQMWHCFDPERDAGAALLAAVERHEPAFHVLPKTARDVLGAIRAGKGQEIVNQDGPLRGELLQALYEGGPDSSFPMERGTGVWHAGMFEHPAAAAYVQEFAGRCFELVAGGFDDLGQPPEMWDEHGNEIAALCILLQLQPCRVPAESFRDWWGRYRAAEGDDDLANLETFEIRYRRCVWRALNYGLMRFSGEPKPAPLDLDEPKELDEDEE